MSQDIDITCDDHGIHSPNSQTEREEVLMVVYIDG